MPLPIQALSLRFYRGDKNHQPSASVYHALQQIYLPQSTLTEIAYLLRQRAGEGAMVKFLNGLPASKFTVTALNDQDLSTTADILARYTSSRIDFVDGTVMAVAERMKITTVLTVDYRDFRLYRPRHCAYFTLLPEQQ
ncbi:MAG: PIN domain-containing protein [Caldilineaceae bacterium]